MALSLNDLNDDVLIIVFEWLLTVSREPFVSDRQARHNRWLPFSRVNKRIRDLAIPLIFKHLQFVLYEPDEQRLASFLSAFEANEFLRSRVKKLTVGLYEPRDGAKIGLPFPRLISVWSSLSSLTTLSLEDIRRDERAALEGSFASAQGPVFPHVTKLQVYFSEAYIIQHCPKVIHLDLMCSEDEIFDDRADFDAQLEKCMSHVPKLKSLRFEMAYDDDRGQYYVDARMLGTIVMSQPGSKELCLADRLAMPPKQLLYLLAQVRGFEKLDLPSPVFISASGEANKALFETEIPGDKATQKAAALILGPEIIRAHPSLTSISFDGFAELLIRTIMATRDWEGKLLSTCWKLDPHPFKRSPLQGNPISDEDVAAWMRGPNKGLWLASLGLYED